MVFCIFFISCTDANFFYDIILFFFTIEIAIGTVRKLRKHIGVLSWSEKGNFCLFLVLKRGTQLVKNSQKHASVIYERPLGLRILFDSVVRYSTSGICFCQYINQTRIYSFTANVSLERALVRAMVVAALCFLKEGRRSQGCAGVNYLGRNRGTTNP